MTASIGRGLIRPQLPKNIETVFRPRSRYGIAPDRCRARPTEDEVYGSAPSESSENFWTGRVLGVAGRVPARNTRSSCEEPWKWPDDLPETDEYQRRFADVASTPLTNIDSLHYSWQEKCRPFARKFLSVFSAQTV